MDTENDEYPPSPQSALGGGREGGLAGGREKGRDTTGLHDEQNQSRGCGEDEK